MELKVVTGSVLESVLIQLQPQLFCISLITTQLLLVAPEYLRQSLQPPLFSLSICLDKGVMSWNSNLAHSYFCICLSLCGLTDIVPIVMLWSCSPPVSISLSSVTHQFPPVDYHQPAITRLKLALFSCLQSFPAVCPLLLVFSLSPLLPADLLLFSFSYCAHFLQSDCACSL